MKIKQTLTLSLFTLCLSVVALRAQEKIFASVTFLKEPAPRLRNHSLTPRFVTRDKEIKDGKVVYEAEGVTDGKIIRNIMYTADGTLVQMEETMTITDVPSAVSDSITSQYPKATVQSALRLTHGEIVEYVLKLKGAPVKTAVVDKDGKITRTK